MTREAAKVIIKAVYEKQLKDEFLLSIRDEVMTKVDKAFKVAFELLDNEPCEDAISRKELKKWLDMNFSFGGASRKIELFDRLDKELSPVAPTRKKGKWENLDSYHYYNDGEIETAELRCSCCNEIVEWDIESPHKPYYCENCGAEMESE